MELAQLFLVFSGLFCRSFGQDQLCPDDSPFRYEVAKGDCLFRLAKATATSINQWLAYNPQITDENFIEVGWILCAPVGSVVTPTNARCDGRRTAQKLPINSGQTGNGGNTNFGQGNVVTVAPVGRRTAPRVVGSGTGGKIELPTDSGDALTTKRRVRKEPTTVAPVGPDAPGNDGGINGGNGGTQDNGNNKGFVFGLQNPGFQRFSREPDSATNAASFQPALNSNSPDPTPATATAQPAPPSPTQFIQLPASASSDDAPTAVRPPIDQARTPQNPLQKSQSQTSPLASSVVVPAQPPGSIDPNIVQCQFFDSGFVNCLRGCTVDRFQWDVDAASGTKIMMRQCIENKAPAVHTWLADDGVLSPWLKPKLIPAGQAEKIIAACTFTRDRLFSCQSTTKCDTRFQLVDGGCSGGAGATQWKGRTTDGDPLKRGSVLKGAITDLSQDASQEETFKRQVRQSGPAPPFLPKRVLLRDFARSTTSLSPPVPFKNSGGNMINRKKRQIGRPTTKRIAGKKEVITTTEAPKPEDCGATAKLCLIMRDAALAEPTQQTCYALRDDGSTRRLSEPVFPVNDTAFPAIRAKMLDGGLQRSECRYFGKSRYFCKGYTGDFCTKQGEQVDNVTSIMYNECYITDEWSDNAPANSTSCDPIAPYIRTCILQKGWDKDIFLSATCYEKQAGPTSANSAVARLGETDAVSLQAIVDEANKRHVLRTECDFVGSMYYCTGYTANYCDGQWDGKIQSNYWDCHAAVTWMGSFKLDTKGAIHLN